MFATWITQQIVLDGVVNGFIYGLLAMSIVLIYRSTKVINFAVGNMGLVGAGLLVILDANYGVPFWIAVVIAVVVGTLYGALIELVVIRRLFKAPRVIVLVATIGVAQLSLLILTAYPNLLGSGPPFPEAVGSTWNIGSSLQLKGAELLILIAAPIVAIGLGWFLNRTMLGRSVRAAAGNPDLARLSGISPRMRSTLVWALGGFVATVSMILIGGFQGTTSSFQDLGPNTLLRALIAAVIARLTSFRTALIAALVIGVVQEIIQFNFLDQPGLTDVLLLVVALIAVWLQSRSSGEGESAFSFTPPVETIPARLKAMFWVRNLDRGVLLVILAVVVAVPIFITQPSRLLLYATIAAFAICALSLTVLTGWAGQLSLGQMAFAGIGALTAAALTRGLAVHWVLGGVTLINFELYGLPFVVSILIGALFTALLSAIIGVGALRVRGLLLAVTTFAFAIAAPSWVYGLDVFSNGKASSVDFPRGDLFGLDLQSQRTYFYVVLVVLVLVVALLGRLRRNGVGRTTLAVRDNADAAASYTVRPSLAKLRAFALAGFIAGLGGGLLAGGVQGISFSDSPFVVTVSLSLVAMIVIGGMGSTAGAVIGAVWVIGLPAFFPDSTIIPLLSSSVGLLLLLLYFPGGLIQIAYNVRSRLYRWLEDRLPPAETVTSAGSAAVGRTERAASDHEVALRLTGVSVAFGGLKANDEVSIDVRNGEIVGLIGTNGAGKTTLMNALGGFVGSTGRVELMGEEISGKKPAQRARRGLGRTFQAATLFPELTVRETVEVALEARGRTSLLKSALFSPGAVRREHSKRTDAVDLIDFLGLGRYADKPISDLSTGTRRIVELAGLLALDARVLCLDEPTAGIAQRETEAMGTLLVEVRRELGASMLIIEHDMPLIMSMSDRVYCLELGRVIAEGEPDHVRNDPAVIASYLGTDERTTTRTTATIARDAEADSAPA
jgi:ABC-type branched-subunit amino acid transport system ATPase component/ABC-type branched-subunit amino acid transport system permease subunit